MKKFIKKISFLTTVFLLILSMITPTVAFSLPGASESNALESASIVNLDAQGRYSVAEEFIEEFGNTFSIFFCSDRNYFVGFYDMFTNRASFVNSQGELLGYLYLASEQVFHELIMFNIEAITGSHSIETMRASASADDKIKQNISMFSAEPSMLMALVEVEFDQASYLSYFEATNVDLFSSDEAYNLIKETLTSAIDDSPFIASFNIITGRVSALDMGGVLLEYIYVDSEEAFWELVAINREVTSRINDEQSMRTVESNHINRNVSIVDLETGLLIEYDDYGNRTETSLDEEELQYITEFGVATFSENNVESRDFGLDLIMPLFDTGQVTMTVPMTGVPEQGAFVGMIQHHHTSSAHTHVELRTFAFPAGMQSLAVFFTNIWGTDRRTAVTFQENSIVSFAISAPGTAYGARVSSVWGTFPGVRLQFSARGNASNPIDPSITRNITYNCNFLRNSQALGSLPQNQPGIVVNSDVTLRTNTGNLRRTGYVFDGWTENASGTGRQFNAGETIRMPNRNLNLFANWRPNQGPIDPGPAPGTVRVVYHNNEPLLFGSVPPPINVPVPGSFRTPSHAQTGMIRPGYTFEIWRDNATGDNHQTGDLIHFHNNRSFTLNLTAMWRPLSSASLTRIDLWNGAYANPSHQRVYRLRGGTIQSGDLPTRPTMEGSRFGGWHGHGEFTYGFVVPSWESHLDFWASWSPNHQVTVNFLHHNGRTGVQGQTTWHNIQQAVPLRDQRAFLPSEPLPPLSNPNLQFYRWSDQQIGGSQITLDSVIAYNTNIHTVNFHAQWRPRQARVTFHDNVPPHRSWDINMSIGQQIGAANLAGITRTGYNFLGWFDARTGGNRVMLNTVVSGNMNLYARWGQNARLDEGEAFLYRIRIGNHYMGVDNNGNIRLSNNISTHGYDNRYATDLWSIVHVGGGFYTIESLGFRQADLRSLSMLTGSGGINSTTGQLSLFPPSNSHSQQWRIQRVGATGVYYFINRQNPHLMIRTGASGVNHTVDMSTNTARAEWTLERYTATSLIQGGYVFFPSPPTSVILSIGVVTEAISINPEIGNAWNGITDNVIINMFEVSLDEHGSPTVGWPTDLATWPNFGVYTGTFNVIVEGWDFNTSPGRFTRTTIGAFIPDGNTAYNPSYPGGSWTWGTILLSNRPDGPATSGIDQEATFVHEIGHALKLNHPGWSGSNIVRADWRPLSVMNSALASDPTRRYMLASPSGYDRFNLIRKWGR